MGEDVVLRGAAAMQRDYLIGKQVDHGVRFAMVISELHENCFVLAQIFNHGPSLAARQTVLRQVDQEGNGRQ